MHFFSKHLKIIIRKLELSATTRLIEKQLAQSNILLLIKANNVGLYIYKHVRVHTAIVKLAEQK